MANLAFACGLGLIGAMLVVAPGSGVGQEADPGSVNKKLREVERALQKGKEKSRRLELRAVDLEKEMDKARLDRIAQARKVQKLEAENTSIELALTRLDAEEAKKKFFVRTSRRAFSDVLMTLQRLALHPPEALIARPGTPSQLVRTAIMLRATVPRFEARAQRMRANLDALAQIRARILARRHQLSTAESRLAAQRHRLDELLASKAADRRRTLAQREAESRRLALLAGQAKDLRELFERLEQRAARRAKEAKKPGHGPNARRPAPGPTPRRSGPPMSQARGRLPFPAAGRIASRFGQTRLAGVGRKGVTIETRPHAQVIAPYDGNVVFAEKFRSYGRLLIIDHGEGYHTLLAGFTRIDVSAGQWVLAGEPVGLMGLSKSGGTSLYVELRHKGKSINPVPWLVAVKVR